MGSNERIIRPPLISTTRFFLTLASLRVSAEKAIKTCGGLVQENNLWHSNQSDGDAQLPSVATRVGPALPVQMF